jgi:hypothetical protein
MQQIARLKLYPIAPEDGGLELLLKSLKCYIRFIRPVMTFMTI